ncbi:transposase family protein [Nostoc sp. CALU 546]|uniref:transposase family protein n=1 Tax=Nostoc sp. CALU 546 TaxID=1867241 RepID=UPI003B66E744
MLTPSQEPKTLAMDVTESPTEGPKYGQKRFFSGKQKRHTLKSQFVIDLERLQVICVVNNSVRRLDFRLFIHNKVRFHPHTKSLEDSGYQGIAKFYAHSYVPIKKPIKGKLTKEEKQFNRDLARRKVAVEYVNRTFKIFLIFSQRYRNGRKQFALRCHLTKLCITMTFK